MTEFRTEHDSMGDIAVPSTALWGAQTQRALHFFAIGNEPMPIHMITGLALVKKAVAETHAALGDLPEECAALISRACDEILDGTHDDMFPLNVWISGSGTQFNMNMNEVIANLCCRYAGTPLGSKAPVHPNDHVNKGHSTNDAFPTAMHIAAAISVQHDLYPALAQLRLALERKADEWRDIIKCGRTHLQDATVLTLGQEFSGYAQMLNDAQRRIETAMEDVMCLTLGGTAVGTGVNTRRGFAEKAIDAIACMTDLPFVPVENTFAAQGAHDALVHLSGACKSLAVSLKKIADDIRLLASGPRAGLGELSLPANEPGSSIMPGKVNPTQCEALTMIALQVMANDLAVSAGGASGHLEMNAYKPLIIFNLLMSLDLLAGGMRSFAAHCVEGITPCQETLEQHVAASLMCVTALTPHIGYDKAAEIAHHAWKNNTSARDAASALGYVEPAQFDAWVQPKNMIAPAEDNA